MKKIILLSSLAFAGSISVLAQSGTNSPYSQYGFGVLSEQSQGFNRGMNGLALGLRYHNQVNVQNPASYSAIDSLTMIFDVGLSGQITSFEENGRKLNANNADFEYAVGAFRLLPNIGVGFGLIPFTSIGYNYTNKPDTRLSSVSFTETHTGSGGLHQAFVGVGWCFLKEFSVGANFSYLWGSYDRSISIASTDGNVNTEVKSYTASVNSYKVDFGLQWQQKMLKDGLLTVGATYGVGHNLHADAEYKTSSTNSQTGVITEPPVSVVNNALSIPHTFGLGVSWKHADRLTIGADYTLQKWGSLDFPEINSLTGDYVMKSGLLKDRSKFTLGCEWVPNPLSQHFLSRVNYRVGASMATPYIKVNGKDGPKEYSVSAGFGIPVSKGRSYFNLSGQWVHASSTGLITENTFRVNIGITFNERWFMKWKVE